MKLPLIKLSPRRRACGRRTVSRLLAALMWRLAGLLRLPALRLRLRAVGARWSTVAVAFGLGAWQAAQAQTPPLPPRIGLPNACVPGACGPNVTFNPLGSVTLNGTASTLTINQTSGTAILNWRDFNIAAGNSVVFRQPDANAVALNRIYDPNVTRIDGSLQANGQVYLINPNGLLFGSTARVDVGGLIASTLNIADDRVRSGLLSDPRVAVPVFAGGLDGAAANPAGRIDVFAGATIRAAGRDQAGTVVRAGNVFLFAPEVNNAGSIQVDGGGQVIFAAGQRVFLTGSNTPTLRGLLVEVGEGGRVTHSGDIQSARGDVTLIGMAVNQAGRISATSALRENGSIRLIARQAATDGAPANQFSVPQPGFFLQARSTGTVTVGSGSRTEVVLDRSDTATAPLNDEFAAQARSAIVIEGAQVRIGGDGAAGNTVLQARGGDVQVTARADATAIGAAERILGAEDARATVTIGRDVRIDVSGERDVAVDGARNFVFIDRLTSSDLRDAPLQRDGFLRGQGVYLNVAQEHPFIDVSSRRAAVAGTQAERNASGGTIALRAEGAVEVAAGAVLDVSGGNTRTSAASGRTSQLIDETGRIVDISRAQPGTRYVGFADSFTRELNAPREGVNSSTRFDAPRSSTVGGFDEGRAAGTVEVVAPRGTLGGEIVAAVAPGSGQRTPPAGGTLRIGSNGDNSNLDLQASLSRANVLIAADVLAATAQLPAEQRDRLLAVDGGMLRRGNVTRIDVVSDGRFSLAADAPLDLGPGGRLAVDANAVDIGASVRAAGGSIRIGERPLASSDAQGVRRDERNLVAEAERGSVRFGVGIELDVAGRFTNDAALPADAAAATPIVRNGGRVDISGRRLDLTTVARIAVDAGASVARNGTVTGGRAGALSLRGSQTAAGLPLANDGGTLVLGAGFAQRISGFGFTAGGELSITAPRLQVGGLSGAGEVGLSTALFDRGFENFTLRGTDSMRVALGAVVQPRVRLLTAEPDARLAADGSPIGSVARALLPANALPRPAQVVLRSDLPAGRVLVETGARIDAGTQGRVQLTAGRQVLVDGELAAAGGSVSMSLGSAPLTGGPATVDNFAGRVIQLGANARVDVSGVSTVREDARGVRRGEVLDGGSVVLSAPLGTVAIDAGARVVADGARDSVDLPASIGTERREIASAGGMVSLAAQQGLIVNGTLQARGGLPEAPGGRLSVQLSGLPADQRTPGVAIEAALLDGLYRQDRELVIGEAAPALPGLGSAFDPAGIAGRGYVRGALINGAGFDQVWLSSTNAIVLPQSQSLATRGSLVLESQVLRAGDNATVSVRAPYVSLGLGPRPAAEGAGSDAAARGGSGTLAVDARNVDLVGDLTLQGIGRVDIRAADDLRLRGGGQPNELRPQGSLSAAADIQLTAAQVYPATQTDFTIRTVDKADATIRVSASGNAPLDPLSAAGSVTFRSPNYVQTGRVIAPHGAITIDASADVTVGAGAELSIAGSGTVPFGSVFNRALWTYANDPAAGDSALASVGGVRAQDKRIDIAGRRVDVAPGARIDIGGGGDLQGAEFVAGPGGSVNVSLNFVPAAGGSTTQRNPLFALLPARGSALAPFDPLTQSNLTGNAAAPNAAGTGASTAALPFGSTITIAAGGPIPAGTYTVMPPRYALLPGAVAVEPVAGLRDILPGRAITEAAGTTIVAGRLGQGDAGTAAARWSGFRIYTREHFGRLAEFQTYSADAFFAAAARVAEQAVPRLPRDAGGLSVAGDALRLAGTIDAQPGAGGRGGDVALSAPTITVVDGSAPAAGAPQADLQLAAAELNALQAERLVLGARVSVDDSNGIALTRDARRVTVAPGARLAAGEVLLNASERVEVRAGAVLEARADLPSTTRAIAVRGDGAALLASSAATLPAFTRSDASPAGTATRGELSVAGDVRLQAESVLFDGTRAQDYAPSVALSARNVGLSGAVVNLGDVPAGTAGLNLSNALLAQFASARSFSVRSASGFNVYGNAALGAVDASGAPTLASLTLDGGSINGFASAAGVATITAGRIELRNGSNAAALPAGDGSGELRLRAIAGGEAAGHVVHGGGAIAITCFSRTQLRAEAAAGGSLPRGELQLLGSGRLDVAGALDLAATRVIGGRAAQHALAATGALNIAATGSAATTAPDALGATMSFEGRSVAVSGRIAAPSGRVALRATGTAEDLVLQDGAVIDVAGSTQAFATTHADASAGQVALSAGGNVLQQAGARIDLRGAGAEGDAGTLGIAAGGTVRLDGRVLTAPGSRARGADITVDAGRLDDLSAVTAAIAAGADGAQAERIALRVRNGDTRLAAGERIAARQIVIAADGVDAATSPAAGQLRIDGTLDAAGERGGRIELHARDQVLLGGEARLEAGARAAGEAGGDVLLSARVHEAAASRPALDGIVVTAGARVDVSAATAADAGTVTLRSARIGDDVAIAPLPSFAPGARREIVEGVVLVTATGNLALSPTGAATAANPLPGLRATLQSYMSSANRAAIIARLNRSDTPGFSLRPGIEIRTPGDITVAAATDFSAGLVAGDTGSSFQWRYGGDTLAASDPGALTLRAGGNVNVNQILSDGVTGQAGPAAFTLRPFASGDSWRFQLTGGADLSAASAAATAAPVAGRGNVAIGAAGAVRTGTGRIDIAAANDITLAAQTSVVFSAGVASVAGPEFTNPQVALLNPPPQFTRDGGSVSLSAGRDISATGGSNQLVNEWLWRVGGSDTPAAWWSNVARFAQGVGALGGGDLSLHAGRDINRVGASVPTNAFVAADGTLSERNGGRLEVVAGNRVGGGTYYAQRGAFHVRAGEVVGSTAADQLRVAHGGNEVDIQADRDLRVVAAFNPTWAAAANAQLVGGGTPVNPRNVAFSTFGPASALMLRSLNGEVSFGGSLGSALGPALSSNPSDRRPFNIAAPNVDLVSFGGDVSIEGALLMYPDARGQLRILADRDIGGQGAITMSDLDPATLPSAAAPDSLPDLRRRFAATGALGAFNLATTNRHASLPRPLHADDTQPVQIVARDGSITSITIDVPKPLQAAAGRDIGAGARLLVQNTGPDSVTRIGAGRNIDFSASGGSAEDFAIEIRGPGAAEILAGGSINLGTGGGIVSRGNLANAFLPAEGAALLVAAGVGRGADGFAQAPDYGNALRQFIRNDAFAAAGSDAAALNAAVLEAKFEPAVRDLLLQALADRTAIDDPASSVSRALAALTPRQLQQAGVTLVAQVQRVTNARFVSTRNTDTFAPGYVALGDLFPAARDDAGGLRSFVRANPFGTGAEASALRDSVVARMPAAVAALLRLGLASPGSVDDPTSDFSRALDSLAPAQLQAAGRLLQAQALGRAGEALDALRAAGRIDAGAGTPFARTLTDFAAAFSPGGAPGTNDISLVFSQIKAEQSGSLALFAPRGGVLVGQANPPAGAIAKRPDQLGILTLGGGDIVGAVRDNFDVFRSRVFTIAGGDVQLWSSTGNIDAGRGPRDVTVAPPPRLSVAPDGSVTFDVTASVSGSGIGALRTRANQPPSDIRLIAPKGFIDAGEAGIRADAGTVTLGTNIVLNAGNISAGGGVAGGAVVVAPPAPLPASSVGDQATRALDETQRAAVAQQKEAEERAERERRKRVRGEFVGFGDD